METIETASLDEIISLFGQYDTNAKLIEKELGVRLYNRETSLKVEGESEENVEKAKRVICALLLLIKKGELLTQQNIRYTISMVNDDMEEHVSELAQDVVCVTSKGKPIKAKTLGQKSILRPLKTTPLFLALAPPEQERPIWR